MEKNQINETQKISQSPDEKYFSEFTNTNIRNSDINRKQNVNLTCG